MTGSVSHTRAALVVLAVLLALGACTKPTPYAPAAGSGFGYSETKIDEDTTRIEVAGNSRTPRDLVENQLLYRAAQLAQERGAKTFVLVTRDTERNVQYWTEPLGVFPYGYSGIGFGRRYGGFGFAYAPTTTRAIDRYTMYAEARFYEDEPPAGLGPSYNAAEVLHNLKGKINFRPASNGITG